MADLLIRETILGIFKAKDTTGSQSLHTSEIRKAFSELGIYLHMYKLYEKEHLSEYIYKFLFF